MCNQVQTAGAVDGQVPDLVVDTPSSSRCARHVAWWFSMIFVELPQSPNWTNKNHVACRKNRPENMKRVLRSRTKGEVMNQLSTFIRPSVTSNSLKHLHSLKQSWKWNRSAFGFQPCSILYKSALLSFHEYIWGRVYGNMFFSSMDRRLHSPGHVCGKSSRFIYSRWMGGGGPLNNQVQLWKKHASCATSIKRTKLLVEFSLSLSLYATIMQVEPPCLSYMLDRVGCSRWSLPWG